MLRELIKLASDLDSKGFVKEADKLDAIILKMSRDEAAVHSNPELTSELILNLFKEFEAKRAEAKDDIIANVILERFDGDDTIHLSDILYETDNAEAARIPLVRNALNVLEKQVSDLTGKDGYEDLLVEIESASSAAELSRAIEAWRVQFSSSQAVSMDETLLMDSEDLKKEIDKAIFGSDLREAEAKIYSEVIKDLMHYNYEPREEEREIDREVESRLNKLEEKSEEVFQLSKFVIAKASDYLDFIISSVEEFYHLEQGQEHSDKPEQTYQEVFEDSMEPIGNEIEEIEDSSEPYKPDTADRDSVFAQQGGPKGPSEELAKKYFPDRFFS